MFANRSISRIFSLLFNITLILTLLIGSANSPTNVNAAGSTSAPVDSKSAQVSSDLMQPGLHQARLPAGPLQVVTFAPLTDACTDSCAATQTAAIASCNSAFDPAMCGGDLACEADLITQGNQCIADANTAFDACTEACTPPVSCDTCDQIQADGIAWCDANLDPAACGGDATCEAEVIPLYNSCIADANTAYDACTSSCAPPPVSCTTCSETHYDCIIHTGGPIPLAVCDAQFNSCIASCIPPAPVSCTTCDQNQADAIASCNANLDISACGGDPGCEAEVIPLRNSCIADANTVHNMCTTSCVTRRQFHALLVTKL